MQDGLQAYVMYEEGSDTEAYQVTISFSVYKCTPKAGRLSIDDDFNLLREIREILIK